MFNVTQHNATAAEKLEQGKRLLRDLKHGELADYDLTVRLSEFLYWPGTLEVAGYIRPEEADILYAFYPDSRRALDVYYDVCPEILDEEQANRLHNSTRLQDDYRRLNQMIFEIARNVAERSSIEIVLAWRFAGHRAKMFVHSATLNLEAAMHKLFEEFVEYLQMDLELY